MTPMSVADETSQLLMSSLKVEHAGLQLLHALEAVVQKRREKSVTCDTSHCSIGPCVARAVAGLAHQSSRASRSELREKGWGGGGGGSDGLTTQVHVCPHVHAGSDEEGGGRVGAGEGVGVGPGSASYEASRRNAVAAASSSSRRRSYEEDWVWTGGDDGGGIGGGTLGRFARQ